MAKVTPQEYADKWANRLSGSTEDIRRGVDKVTEAPGLAAARQKEAMKQKLLKAIDDGTWEAMVSSVTLEDWKKAATEKGLARIGQGVESAKPKQVMMAEKLLPAVDAAAAAAKALPKVTLEDSINRSATFIREMNKRKIRRPR